MISKGFGRLIFLFYLSNSIALTQVPFEPKHRIKTSVQDSDGFIWLGTNTGIFRYDGYDFKNLNEISQQDINKNLKQITKLHIDKNSAFWIGTQEKGLFLFDGSITKRVNITKAIRNTNEIIYDIISDNSSVWIASNYGLYKSTNSVITHFSFPKRSQPYNIKTIINKSKEELIINTGYDVLNFSKKEGLFTPIELPLMLNKNFKWDIYLEDGRLWVASNTGVFFINKNNKWQQFKPSIINFPVRKIISNKTHMWFGSIENGLIQYNKNTDQIVNHRSELGNQKAITNNQVFSLLLDRTNLLWVFLFNGDINTLDTQTEKFGFNADTINTDCSMHKNALAFAESNQHLWINSKESVLKINKTNGSCLPISNDKEGIASFKDETTLSSLIDHSNNLWVGSSKGLHIIEKNSDYLRKVSLESINKFINLIVEYDKQNLLLGTEDGLYKFNKTSQTTNKILFKKESSNIQFNDFTKSVNDKLYFATSNGIYTLQNENLYIFEELQNQLPNRYIHSVHFDKNNSLWVGTASNGLFQYDFDQKVLQQIHIKENLSVKSIESDIYDNIWIGTTEGLYFYDIKTKDVKSFIERDGLQDNYFYSGSSYINKMGLLYFGGLKGYNKFDPAAINTSSKSPNPTVELTSIKRFNNEVLPFVENDGFMINQPIDQLKELTLTHKDYVMSFGFAAMDFNDSSRNKYAYQLSGFDPKWNYVDANNRLATYTNLPAGNYTLKIKGSNKNGVWSEQPKTLKIKVLPAPWFSWWAISAYVLTLMVMVLYYVQRKTRANRKMAELLRIEVKQKTKEIQKQKQTVESLLDKKNELFANVSHEFRTPLTLILGPINSLLNAHLPKHNLDEVSMVKRNATRLLTLVEQLLQMAKISGNNVEFIPQFAHIQVQKIVESFHYLASEKRIELTLLQNDMAAVKTTKLAIEIILSNLISNAIKYTQTGGKVTVSSKVTSDLLTIIVKDTGCGLDDEQKIEIFKRFKRLDSHLSIEGVGIGLAVVKEVIEANNGQIQVESTLGSGSSFIFSFPVIPIEDVVESKDSAHGLIKQLSNPDSLIIQDELEEKNIKLDSKKDCIVIIEDNKDMRTLIANTLKPHYQCLLAKDGVQGVALAIKYIPDVIISDVMMPGMDGFKVSRMVRSDQRTCHIPLILLTALNDKSSRIKGWRENIDIYLTKPFDADELLMQLNNVITIRNILKRKASVALQQKDQQNLGFNKKDQDFINKLQKCIEDNYPEPLFNRTMLSSKMFMSERQLQRKLKALIDQNPMDMLREYRLKQAAKILKQGQQVSIVTDMCGFNSLSHFSQCFKAHYGVSPKKYQQTCDPKLN